MTKTERDRTMTHLDSAPGWDLMSSTLTPGSLGVEGAFGKTKRPPTDPTLTNGIPGRSPFCNPVQQQI
eukprot:1579527-Amphidinium_carterae.1